MRAIRKIAVVGTTTAALIGLGLGLGGTSAVADPPASPVPALTSLAGVGSDTLTPEFAGSPSENVAGSIAFDYDHKSPAPANAVTSWDAVNPSTGLSGDTIKTKGSSSSDTNCNLARPNGSGAGITALNAGQQDAGDFCIDFARSSRGPNTTSFKDTFVALSKDAIAWTYPKVGSLTNPQPTTLTKAQLQAIYTCSTSAKTWNQVGGSNTDPIVPVLPQAGSGTRSTWLLALGITATTEPCWVNGVAPNGKPIEENSGTGPGDKSVFGQTTKVFESNTATSADIIFPYSIGDWIAQGSAVHGSGTPGTPGGATVGGHASTVFARGTILIGKTTDALGTARPAVTNNSFGQPVINPSFNTQFFRTLYAVVRNGFVNPTSASNAKLPTTPSYDATGLAAFLGTSGWTCTSAVAQSDNVSYGFTNLTGGNCGALTAGD